VPYEALTRVGPSNHVLDRGPDPSHKGGTFEGDMLVHGNTPTPDKSACRVHAADKCNVTSCQIT